jgi:hypothetical protein
MKQENLLVLKMLDSGEITVPEALHLLEVLRIEAEGQAPLEDWPVYQEDVVTVQVYLN